MGVFRSDPHQTYGETAEPVKTTVRLADDEPGRERAARLLWEGGLVGFPTETVYGLGADATCPRAVAGIYAAKGRPTFNPLIAHVGTLDEAFREGRFDPVARKLAQAFWPGPLTLVVPASDGGRVCELARAGLATVALRIPGHETARALIAAVGRPIAAPSANRSGRISPVDADDVMADLAGRIDAVLDGGRVPVGIESTIVACLGGFPVVLRPGGIASDDIARIAGRLGTRRERKIVAPGMTASHYAPVAPLRLHALALQKGEVGLDFAGRFCGRALDLSPTGNLVEAAANLYRYLRRLDAGHPRGIAVAPIPTTGLGEAINDRLCRAAAPRTPGS